MGTEWSEGIFGSKGEKVTGGWNKFHGNLQNLYSSPNHGGWDDMSM